MAIKKHNYFYVVCDNIRSLENIGSIFRTADAAGADKVFLCGICGQPPHHRISKTALGAEEKMSWEYHKQAWRLINKLKKEKTLIVVLETGENSVSFWNFKPEFPMVLVVGNEVGGVSKSVVRAADKIIHIPMDGIKESLNVAVAFGIAAYQINKNKLRKHN